MDLPEDLVILILEKLPPASLLRFKSVCKSWRCIISAPGFLQRSILLRSKLHETSMASIEVSRDKKKRFFIDPSSILESPNSSLPTEFGPLPQRSDRDFWHHDVVVVGSCRGIVCLADRKSGRFLLWNPTTRESRALPQHVHCRQKITGECVEHVGMADYGGDLKVILISNGGPPTPVRVHARIYELSLDSWREISPDGIERRMTGPWNFTRIVPACRRDGMMYWVADYSLSCQTECKIISFNMESERFTSFRFVLPFPRRIDSILLLPLNDLIAGCFSSGSNIDIWVMLPNGVAESWTKLWSIQRGPELDMPLEFWNGGLVMSRHDGNRLIWCDLSDPRGIIHTLPVHASRRGSSLVACFEKTHASIYRQKEKGPKLKKKKNKRMMMMMRRRRPPNGMLGKLELDCLR